MLTDPRARQDGPAARRAPSAHRRPRTLVNGRHPRDPSDPSGKEAADIVSAVNAEGGLRASTVQVPSGARSGGPVTACRTPSDPSGKETETAASATAEAAARPSGRTGPGNHPRAAVGKRYNGGLETGHPIAFGLWERCRRSFGGRGGVHGTPSGDPAGHAPSGAHHGLPRTRAGRFSGRRAAAGPFGGRPGGCGRVPGRQNIGRSGIGPSPRARSRRRRFGNAFHGVIHPRMDIIKGGIPVAGQRTRRPRSAGPAEGRGGDPGRRLWMQGSFRHWFRSAPYMQEPRPPKHPSPDRSGGDRTRGCQNQHLRAQAEAIATCGDHDPRPRTKAKGTAPAASEPRALGHGGKASQP